jgi:hypothetical protein
MRRAGVKIYSYDMVEPGAVIRDEARSALLTSVVAVLLISVDYLASDLMDHELPDLLEQAEQRGTRILRLQVDNCDLSGMGRLTRYEQAGAGKSPLERLRGPRQDDIYIELLEATRKRLIERNRYPKPLSKLTGGYMANDRVEAPLLFYSYAHEDEPHLARLRTHLTLLKRENKISEWYDRKISPGDEWDTTIKAQLERARVILLLVSADFIASDYCWGTEVRRALEKHRRKEAIVIPVILSPTDWHSAPFGKLQALPADGKPITTWANRDQAWTEVAKGIRTLVGGLSP